MFCYLFQTDFVRKRFVMTKKTLSYSVATPEENKAYLLSSWSKFHKFMSYATPIAMTVALLVLMRCEETEQNAVPHTQINQNSIEMEAPERLSLLQEQKEIMGCNTDKPKHQFGTNCCDIHNSMRKIINIFGFQAPKSRNRL